MRVLGIIFSLTITPFLAFASPSMSKNDVNAYHKCINEASLNESKLKGCVEKYLPSHLHQGKPVLEHVVTGECHHNKKH